MFDDQRYGVKLVEGIHKRWEDVLKSLPKTHIRNGRFERIDGLSVPQMVAAVFFNYDFLSQQIKRVTHGPDGKMILAGEQLVSETISLLNERKKYDDRRAMWGSQPHHPSYQEFSRLTDRVDRTIKAIVDRHYELQLKECAKLDIRIL
jgi:hypothetical protein